MAFDQNSAAPKDLRPINIARNGAEETRITPPTSTRAPDGFYPNPGPNPSPNLNPNMGSVQGWGGGGDGVTSPPSMPVYYPDGSVGVSGGYSSLAFGSPHLVHTGAGPTTVWTTSTTRMPAPQLSASGPVPAANLTPRVGSGGAFDQVSEDGSESALGKKVKFLCSFGGKILPRPSDGMLRYVGGQTRIISVRRDVTYGELVQKMVDTYGQAVVIKYQLPDEDLDALVSVACPDDLDNMMEEYEKLAERSADGGSAKLRVFLFSAAELDPCGAVLQVPLLGDLQDTGQRYVDAVNGIVDGVGVGVGSGVGVGAGVGITRKESIASVASTQNSDMSGTDAAALDSGVGQDITGGNPANNNSMFSPRSDSAASTENAPRSDVSAPPVLTSHHYHPPHHVVSSQPEVEIDRSRTVPAQVVQQPQQPLGGYDVQQRGVNFPPPPSSSPYMAHHDQMAFSRMQPQVVYATNPQVLGGAPRPILIQPQFRENVPPAMLAPQFVPAVQMTTMAPPSSHMSMSQNIVQPLVGHPPRVVAVPADHPSYSNAYPGGPYGWMPHQQPVVSRTAAMADCYMCQKALPHAHSDTVVQDQIQKDGHLGPVSEANPIYHSLRLDDLTRIHSVAPQNQGLMGFAGDVQGNYGAVMGNPPVSEPKQDVLVSSSPVSVNTDTVSVGGTVSYQLPEQLIPGTSKEYSGKASGVALREDEMGSSVSQEPKVVDFMDNFSMKATNNADVLPSVEHNMDDFLEQMAPQKPNDTVPPSSVVEGAYQHVVRPTEMVDVVQQVPALGNNAVVLNAGVHHFDGNVAVSNAGMHHFDGNAVMSNAGMHHFDGNAAVHHFDGNAAVSNAGVHNFDGNVAVSNAGVHNFDGNSLFPVAGDPVYYPDRSSPGNDSRDDPLHSNSSARSSISPNAWDALMNDSSNSLFSNQDPWNMRHDAHFPPPKPKNLVKRDTREVQQGENPSGGFGGESNATTHFLDGVQPGVELSHVGMGLAEEQARQQLQATAEGVAASVLHSSPSNPELSSHETTLSVSEASSEMEGPSNSGAALQAKLEAMNLKPEKANTGFPLSDGLGRLQIIKNSDLEELRELGSGTFGTVYHGKWRGTDVAIKRINDRCFAGKASEQERMRDDFWNEAIKLADLHHPNVVAFYGVVLDGPGGSVATVTEYMVNGSLRNALQKNERNLDKRKRLLIAMDVAFGMEYLHSKNIVHFDLKSDNLLVNLRDPHRPICKVGDLGLSKVKCQTLISGGVRGTLPWMAPELLNGSSSLVSEKVDVFSFGIVMWELLTGEEPYADLHYGAIIGGIVSNTLRPLVPENCDPEWRALMERCWSADPPERPNFTEIAHELRAMASKIPSKQQQQQQQQSPATNTRTNAA